MNTNRQLWLHVGLPKTATTAFQSWMRYNSTALAEQGITYPPLFGEGNDKHNFLVGALRQNAPLDRLENLLRTTTADTVVLSDEGLSNHLDDFNDEALARFRELTENWNVRIALVTRDAEAWTRSYHKQCVLNPDNGASPLWGTSLTVSEISNHPRILRLLDTENLMTDLGTAFGAIKVQKYIFESSDWFDNCLDEMGFQHAEAQTLPKTNVSLQNWSIELLRRVNELTGDKSIRNGWKLALQSYLETNHTILTNLSKSQQATVDLEILNRLTDIYKSDRGEDEVEVMAFLSSLYSQ